MSFLNFVVKNHQIFSPKFMHDSSHQLYLYNPIANFSKYISKSRTKRLPLTTKRAGKGYKKGNGARTEGTLNSKGSCIYLSSIITFVAQFRLNREMCTELVVPDLNNFNLKPYIAPGAKRHIKEMKVDNF